MRGWRIPTSKMVATTRRTRMPPMMSRLRLRRSCSSVRSRRRNRGTRELLLAPVEGEQARLHPGRFFRIAGEAGDPGVDAVLRHVGAHAHVVELEAAERRGGGEIVHPR